MVRWVSIDVMNLKRLVVVRVTKGGDTALLTPIAITLLD
jgi:hypothetical protein